MSGRRAALLVATYEYEDPGLRALKAPEADAKALAQVLADAEIADYEVTVLVNQPVNVVGEAIGDFYQNRRRQDLTLLYFTGHGLKDDNGRLYFAMKNTRRNSLLFTGLAAEQIDAAMEASPSQQKILILDCCYSGAFPVGRTAKGDPAVHSLEKLRGRGRVVLTASDATEYAFEGDSIRGEGLGSVFTKYLVEGMSTGRADLDGDGDISLAELYSYAHDKVIEEMPQQRPKKHEDVEGSIVIGHNINWTLPTYLTNDIGSPLAKDRLTAIEGLAHIYRVGNPLVRSRVSEHMTLLGNDDSRSVATAAQQWLRQQNADEAPAATGAGPPPSTTETRPEPSEAITGAGASERSAKLPSQQGSHVDIIPRHGTRAPVSRTTVGGPPSSQAYALSENKRATPQPVVAEVPSVGVTEEHAPEPTSTKPRKSRAGPAFLIGALVLLLLLGGSYGIWWLMSRESPEAAAKVAVPDVLNIDGYQAIQRLTESQLKTEVKHVDGDDKTAGQVTEQDPVAGTSVELNSMVTITVNDGPKTAKIPIKLEGDDVADAQAGLKRKKFSNVTTKAAKDEPADAKENEVLSVTPAEGSTVPLDQKITLVYATGKSKVPVLTGKTPAQAESDARAAGFHKLNREQVQTNAETAGVVFQQSPKAGTTVRRTRTISYKVAVAKPERAPQPAPKPAPQPAPQPSATFSTPTAPAPTSASESSGG